MADMTILWWYWLSFGLVLIGVELFIPSFTIIWFGLGACFVSLVLLGFPGISLSAQLFIWTAASVLFTFLWFRLLKPRMIDRTTAGMSHEAILGETGMVIKSNTSPVEKGKIRFTLPVLGADEWDFTSSDVLALGDNAKVSGIDGHVLKVNKQ